MSTGPVPSVELFRGSVTKPECFEDMPDNTIATVLSQKTDYMVAAFGDRATPPILSWDGSCDNAVIALAARQLMGYRGYKKDAAGDSEYVSLAVAAEEYRKGIKNKEEHPTFVDSTQGFRPDTPKVTGSLRSDDWTYRPERCRW